MAYLSNYPPSACLLELKESELSLNILWQEHLKSSDVSPMAILQNSTAKAAAVAKETRFVARRHRRARMPHNNRATLHSVSIS